MQYLPVSGEGHIKSTILVLGLGIAFFLNLFVSILYGYSLLRKQNLASLVPRWLIFLNLLLLIVQIWFLFI